MVDICCPSRTSKVESRLLSSAASGGTPLEGCAGKELFEGIVDASKASTSVNISSTCTAGLIPDAVDVCTTGAAGEILPTGMVPPDTAVEAPALQGSADICSTGTVCETLAAGMFPPDAIAEATALLCNVNICPEGPAAEAPLLMIIFSPDAADDGLSLVGISEALSEGMTEGANSNSKNSKVFCFGAGSAFFFPEESCEEQLPPSLDRRFS
jgi:hypothetical protein